MRPPRRDRERPERALDLPERADLTDFAGREGSEEEELDDDGMPSPKSDGVGFSMIFRVTVSRISMSSSGGGGGGASGPPRSLVSLVSS